MDYHLWCCKLKSNVSFPFLYIFCTLAWVNITLPTSYILFHWRHNVWSHSHFFYLWCRLTVTSVLFIFLPYYFVENRCCHYLIFAYAENETNHGNGWSIFLEYSRRWYLIDFFLNLKCFFINPYPLKFCQLLAKTERNNEFFHARCETYDLTRKNLFFPDEN